MNKKKKQKNKRECLYTKIIANLATEASAKLDRLINGAGKKRKQPVRRKAIVSRSKSSRQLSASGKTTVRRNPPRKRTTKKKI